MTGASNGIGVRGMQAAYRFCCDAERRAGATIGLAALAAGGLVTFLESGTEIRFREGTLARSCRTDARQVPGFSRSRRAGPVRCPGAIAIHTGTA
ncbi:MAG: hypothetical protein AMJ66_09645 [Betaproteobacteria bacterium SG8_40]|nr:MAG: hypothetical protein AMJ66_09645 [Betaproteobacteria bacterium SG8_40]